MDDITTPYECKQTLGVSARLHLTYMQGFKEFSSIEQEMTSDHNRSELRIHDHSNELSSLKLVPKVEGSIPMTPIFRIVVLMARIEMNVYKGRMPTKIELTLEQSQQGVSNDILITKHEGTSLQREQRTKIKRAQPTTTILIDMKEYHKGLPLKIFENDHSCVACQKGKQHKASYKTKLVNSISKPLHMLHIDLFGPTNVKSLMKKSYCLVVTDDISRFSWVFFFATKDETSGILKTFITEIENQLDHQVKVIRSDNGTEFKNSIMNQFYEIKGIQREFSVARTPQQNGVAERKNRTLVKDARTMLVDSKLPTTFWAEAVNTCRH
ncbi:putative ribonuclease H-like domain-containing protein [Tanacetum coccineum]|uniref:Ribonuclease H-like domain-containing protein n=1 Tax=Tanacetum coccineum TaxID=301880 RepID=A0ABQ4Y1M1_9ASTR